MDAEILTALVKSNLAGAAAITLVLACRQAARRLIGPRLAYALWLIVPVAMIAVLAPPRISTLPAPITSALTLTAQTAAAPALQNPVVLSAALPATPSLDVAAWIAGGWLAGAALFALMILICQHRAVAAFGLIDADRQGYLRASNLKSSPSLIGMLRPRIVLPADFEARFAPSEQAMIIAHERVHLTSGHLWTNAFIGLVQAINWFNPLIHVAAYFLRLDQELACDAAVVERFPGERRTYAQAMLKSQLARTPLPLGCTWPARSNPMLKERIEMLAIKSPTALGRLAGGCALTALVAAAGLAAWASNPATVVYEPAEAAATIEAVAAAEATTGPEEIDAEEGLEVTPADAASEGAPEPQPAAQPAPPIANVNNGTTDMNLNAPVSITGVITMVEWVNPRTVIHVRDESGQEQIIQSQTPNSLLRAGGSRQALAVGTPISLQGYSDKAGRTVYASPVAMMSNGAPLFPLAAEQAAEAAALAARRLEVCGPQPAPSPFPPSEIPTGPTAAAIWQQECSAKLLAASPPAPAAVITQSPFTNSVIRQGQ